MYNNSLRFITGEGERDRVNIYIYIYVSFA